MAVPADRVALSVVVPAYNEAGRLPGTLDGLRTFLAGREHLQPAEVVVVDDGSRDDTAAIVAGATLAGAATLRLIRLGSNQGKGAAVRAGLAASRGEWVLITDADLATPIEELDKLLASGARLAIGSRGVVRELILRRQPLPRDLMGRAYNLFLRLLGLTRLKDTQCGFKLIQGDLARHLASQLRLPGFAFDIELLARAERAGVIPLEVPVRWFHRDASQVRPLRHGLEMLRDSVKVRFWLWVGR